MVYTVTFNPALDYVLKVNDFRVGFTNRSFCEDIQIGGKGINVSVILSRLGVENTSLGFIGGFTGRELVKKAEELNIITDFIELKKGDTRINVKLKSQTETEINTQGPEICEAELQEFLASLNSINDGDTLVLSGSVPKSLPDDIYEKILNHLKDKNIRFCIDAEGELLLKTLKFKPFVVKPNKAELEAIFNKSLDSTEDIISAAKELKNLGAQNVLVSLGGEGAILLDEFGELHITAAHKLTPVNTVGSGDSMLAGFLAGVNKGYEFALRLGNAAGAATASELSLADKERIEYYLNIAL